MSTKKTTSTLVGENTDLFVRVSKTPMISPPDVIPSDPRLRVIGVLNPTFININGKRLLIVRVDERPSAMPMEKNGKVGGKESLLVAYADLEYAGKIEIVETCVHDKFNPDKEPILPEPGRKFSIGIRQQELLLSYISHLRICELNDSKIVLSNRPLAFPINDFSQYGCEDPRATTIEGNHYLLLTTIGKYGATACLANIKNTSLQNNRIILGPDHKHTTLFPQRIHGSYVLLTRPLARSYLRASGIWMLQSPDLLHWGVPTPVLLPRAGMWDGVRVGPCAAPLLTSSGWLLFYYGVDSDNTYRVGAAILDTNNPSKILARTALPVLSPVLSWEREGRRADIVFPCGAELYEETDTIKLYYGAADTCIGVAETRQEDLIKCMS